MEVNQCRLCCRYHSLRFCHAFLAMTPDERYESARVHRYCINCLATSHRTGACNSADSCHRCGLAHHTLLHRATSPPPAHARREDVRSSVRRVHYSASAHSERPTTANNPIQSPRQRASGTNARGQHQIQNLFKKAVMTLGKLQELLHLTPAQAGRHVEDMSSNLIEFD